VVNEIRFKEREGDARNTHYDGVHDLFVGIRSLVRPDGAAERPFKMAA
jgi:hypothetical protein